VDSAIAVYFARGDVEPEISERWKDLFELIVSEQVSIGAKGHVQPIGFSAQDCGHKMWAAGGLSVAYDAHGLDSHFGRIVQKPKDGVPIWLPANVHLKLSIAIDTLVSASAGKRNIHSHRRYSLALQPRLHSLLLPGQFV